MIALNIIWKCQCKFTYHPIFKSIGNKAKKVYEISTKTMSRSATVQFQIFPA